MSFRSPQGEEFVALDDALTQRIISEKVPVVVSECATTVLSIKEHETFLVSANDGGLEEDNVCGLGLYQRDTRFLSVFTLRVNGTVPILLSSSADRSYMSQMDLTNADIWDGDEIVIPQQTINIRRTRVVGKQLHEQIRVRNFSHRPAEVVLQITLGSDFHDIFEVRGLHRSTRGTSLQPKLAKRGVTLAYLGTDDLFRQTLVEFSDDPQSSYVRSGQAAFSFSIPLRPSETKILGLRVEPRVGIDRPEKESFDSALAGIRDSYDSWYGECTTVSTDNEMFNALLERSRRDIRALYTTTRFGSMLSAGIPWYVAAFGRDSILSAYEILLLNSRVSAETLRMLAALQGRQSDPWRDEEPGKIFHEVRQGELAFANLIPHTPYYGTADATPLFIMLAAAHFRWTNDTELVTELRPALKSALRWIDEHGDMDGDGFVEYQRRSPRGLQNQGWKDSVNSVVHTDGSLAKGPIALAEVQAYVYMAKSRLAEIFEILGDDELAEKLHKQARLLKEKFNRDFWMPDAGYFAMALDGEKNQVATITSNPAHGLYCGIIDADKAGLMAQRLMADDMFSGWGVRTLSKLEVPYNPMSYHNGSVWPHDNAMIAAGLKRYGFKAESEKILTALFESAVESEYLRLPELFCGFTRRSVNPPVHYPVACSPQAWSAAAAFFCVQAMLGISARAQENLLSVNRPSLPSWLGLVRVRNLKVGASEISMQFSRTGDTTSFSMLDKRGDVRVVMQE